MPFPPVLVAHLPLTLSSEILGDIRDAGQPAINLPTVEDARYNSADVRDDPICQEDTRVAVRAQITTWANDITSETIYWLHGPAGTGKSTIARTLADSFEAEGQLVAGYFFKRGEKDRNSTARFFPTIAAQLIDNIPQFETCLRMSLGKLGNAVVEKVEKRALEDQFKTLILTPLSQLLPGKSANLPRVIVIDAVDECEQYDHIPRILSLFSQLQRLDTMRLRVFLTSRFAYPIVRAFKGLQSKHIAYRSLSLLEDFSDETKADIAAFLRKRFATIKADSEITEDPWPTSKDLDYLISLATTPSPSFIYAATLCRFVDDGTGIKEPTQQLKRWLKQCDRNRPQLNQIYTPILEQLLLSIDEPDDSDTLDDRSQLLKILGSIILLATQLPAQSLASLLDMKADDINRWLRNLHAVLNIPRNHEAPVGILHKSFADFLLGQEGTGTADFRVDAEEIHAMLASKCIRRMENGLGKDICSVRDPGKSRDEIDKAVIVRHIPPDLEYACLYWVYHLQHSGRRITDRDEVCTFLHTHFLHWLESLSWMRKISEGILAIASLETIALVSLPAVYRKLLN
jgi:hypothetical protein